MDKLIAQLEAAIKQATWELNNTSKITNHNAYYLIQGRINGYNHALEMINTLTQQ